MTHQDAYDVGSVHFAAQQGDLRALARMLKGVAEQQGLKEGDAGAVLEVLSARAGSLGRTCLHAGAEGGHVDVVQCLVSHARGIVGAPDNHKSTPLHLATAGGHAAVVHALLQHGASAAASDVEGQTPLHLAASRGNTEVIRVLSTHGAPVSSVTLAGWTPLHGAAFYGRALAAQQLLKTGASLHSRNKEGNTPLHLACLSRHLPTIEALLAAGADMDVPNELGQSPLSLCASPDAMQLFGEERARRLQQQQASVAQGELKQGSPFEAAAKASVLERLGSFNWKPTRRSDDLGFPEESYGEADVFPAALPRRSSGASIASYGSSPLSRTCSRSSSRRMSFRDQQLPGGGSEEPGSAGVPRGAGAAARRSSGFVPEAGTFLEHAMALCTDAGRPALSSPQAGLKPWSWLRGSGGGSSPLQPASTEQLATAEVEGLRAAAVRAKSFTFGSPNSMRRAVLLPAAVARDGLATPQSDASGGGLPLLPAAPRLPRALRKCSTLDGYSVGGSAPQMAMPLPPQLVPAHGVSLTRQGSSSPYSSHRGSGSNAQAPSAVDNQQAPAPAAGADTQEDWGPEERKRAMYLSLSTRLAGSETAVGEALLPPRPLLERSTSRRASMINMPSAAPAAGGGAAAAALLHSSSAKASAAGAVAHLAGAAPSPPPPPPVGSSSFRRRSIDYVLPGEAGSPPFGAVVAGTLQSKSSSTTNPNPLQRKNVPRKNVSFSMHHQMLGPGPAAHARPAPVAAAATALAPAPADAPAATAQPSPAASLGARSKSSDSMWAALGLVDSPAGWPAAGLAAVAPPAPSQAAGGQAASPVKAQASAGGDNQAKGARR